MIQFCWEANQLKCILNKNLQQFRKQSFKTIRSMQNCAISWALPKMKGPSSFSDHDLFWPSTDIFNSIILKSEKGHLFCIKNAQTFNYSYGEMYTISSMIKVMAYESNAKVFNLKKGVLFWFWDSILIRVDALAVQILKRMFAKLLCTLKHKLQIY